MAAAVQPSVSAAEAILTVLMMPSVQRMILTIPLVLFGPQSFYLYFAYQYSPRLTLSSTKPFRNCQGVD